MLIGQMPCTHFQFWSTILQLELYVMIYVRATREGDFQLYIDALTKTVPWFFALDHVHYAKWMTVHLHDMVSLKDSDPDVCAEFLKGKFVVKKLRRAFSAITADEEPSSSTSLDGI